MERANWVIDFETLINCTVLVAIHYKTDERKVFVIHALRNDIKELIKFHEENIENGEWHISFNGIGFDSQISEFIIQNKDLLAKLDGETISNKIYEKSQEVIGRFETQMFQEYSERNLSIRQMDVFKMNHWDNPAKMSSLKWIEYTMDWHNIMEMPIGHGTFIETQEQLDTIVEYCINDVEATKNILGLAKDQIALRKSLTDEYGINLYNASEPKIAKELFLHFLSNKMEMNKWDLKKIRTNRNKIAIKDLILPYVRFNKPEFKKVLHEFNEKVIDAKETKGGFKTRMFHKDVRSDFGLGGIHGARESGVYEAKDGMLLMSSDVVSFYPRLAMVNNWSPAHIPKDIFCEQYQWFFEERMKIPKSDPRNYVYKIVLNSTFGLSIDKHSFLYDPQLGMQITINGQLSLLMLYEMLSEGISGSIPLMQNTDGLETLIPAGDKQKYLDICTKWEEITGLKLEHDEYQKLFLGDVNNYIAVYNYKEISKEEWDKPRDAQFLYKQSGGKYYMAKTKCKGRFEFQNLMLHKNKSFLIIPKAIFNFFIHNIPPETTLAQNKNIFDWCGGAKAKGAWKFKETCVIDGEVVIRDLQKVTRYYISKRGCKMIKYNKNDGREIQVEAGKWLSTEYNKHDPNKSFESFDINHEFYLAKIYKEIANIKATGAVQQLEMF